MSVVKNLPALRAELDIMPSPVPDQPGLLVLDPFQYSDATVIIPPLLARGLAFFNGEHTELDLRAELTRLTGELQTGEVATHLAETLDKCGFVESATCFEMRDAKHREFAEADVRKPAHAGSGYPAEPDELVEKLNGYGASIDSSSEDRLIGLAAPHVSPEGGYESYAAAYRRLRPEHADKTFVILGTSHYGQPEKFGLTRKPYETPLGAVETDTGIVDWLEAQAPGSVQMEDYCHSSEHSIEFQSVFLQHVLRESLPESERLRAVPILCGSFVESLLTGKPPDTSENNRRFFEALGELAESKRDELVWILGIDMAHIGRRYGDQFEAVAEEGQMSEVRVKDEARLRSVCAHDTSGFFEQVWPNRDELRWCGYSPVYTFLKSVGGWRGNVLNYEQWNIDEASVVTFVGAEFVEEGD